MDGVETNRFHESNLAAFLMAAVSGFSDVFGFIALDQLFTAHITGNIVVMISFIIFKAKGIAPKVLAIPLFILLAAIIASAIESHGLTKKSLRFWLALEMILFLALLTVGAVYIPGLSISSWGYIALSMLPVGAMAIHNTILRTFLPKLPPCTVMTGNLTQFVVDVTSFFLGRYTKVHEKKRTATKGIKRYGNVLAGFVLGGLLSTFGYIWFHFYAIAFILILLAVMIYFCDHAAKK